jgi:transcriptional regulator with XRE-family HTH domain
MTQADLAALVSSMGLPIDRSAISRIETQQKSISDIELFYLAAALRADLNRLYRLLRRDPLFVPPYEAFSSDPEEVLFVAEPEEDA